MSILQAILLGIVQGLTEFLPVSSSGHLILVPWAFNWHFFLENPELNKTFDVALHLGTFVAVVVYYWRELLRLLRGFFRTLATRRIRTPEERLAWLLLLSTVPAGIVGVSLEDVIVNRLGEPYLIGLMMIVFGVVMWVVDSHARLDRPLEKLGWKGALAIGVAQAAALAPGVSRSGITMVTGLLLGFDRESAARFSFLMSVPVIGGASLYSGLGVARDGLPAGTAVPFVAGMAAAAVSGFAAIWFLLAYLRRHDFKPFVFYRFAVGAGVLLVIVAGLRPAVGI